MNDLQKLFKLRGLSMQALAEAVGLGEHSVQKTVKGIRKPQHVRSAVAGYLGLEVDQAFGPGASLYLKRLIKEEIAQQAKNFEQTLKQKIHHIRPVNPTLSEQRKASNG